MHAKFGQLLSERLGTEPISGRGDASAPGPEQLESPQATPDTRSPYTGGASYNALVWRALNQLDAFAAR
jgi:hypothetical protein